MSAGVFALVLAQCETHARRMLWAKDALRTAFPLNRLEKIGAPPSVDEWLELREMRNAFAHDYPEDSELQAAILNRAYAQADRLVGILQHVRKFAARYEHV